VSAPPESFWSALPLGPRVRVVARDANGVVAFDKPAGVLSHPNKPADAARSLLNAGYETEEECYRWSAGGAGEGGHARLWLLNRLDSPTSGVILAAADGALAREIRAQFKERQVHKTYCALVFGAPARPEELWRDQLSVDKKGGHIRTRAVGNLPAECRMQLLRSNRAEPRLSLLQLQPLTGRSHQLRVQCARRRLPIVNDASYGDFKHNHAFARRTGCRRLFLHSLAVAFDYEWPGGKTRFRAEAPLPAEFEEFL